jgi:hypothetical protein
MTSMSGVKIACSLVERRSQVGVALAFVAFGLMVAAVVDLHQLSVGQTLLGQCADGAASASALTRGVADQVAEALGHPVEKRDDDQRHERQIPTEQEERGGEEHELRAVGDQVGGASDHKSFDGADIAVQACKDVADLAASERDE